MISSNELMQDNLLLHEGEIFKVLYFDLETAITFKTVGNSSITEIVDLKYLEGIPISEDWLVKLGFDYVSELLGYANDKHFCFFNNKGGVTFNPYCTDDLDFQIEIKYVHELQNITFWLTKQRLTIK